MPAIYQDAYVASLKKVQKPAKKPRAAEPAPANHTVQVTPVDKIKTELVTVSKVPLKLADEGEIKQLYEKILNKDTITSITAPFLKHMKTTLVLN